MLVDTIKGTPVLCWHKSGGTERITKPSSRVVGLRADLCTQDLPDEIAGLDQDYQCQVNSRRQSVSSCTFQTTQRDSDTALRAIRQGTHRQNKLVTCHMAHVVRAHPKAITTPIKSVISSNMTEQVITACSFVSTISCVHKTEKHRRDLVTLFWGVALCMYRAWHRRNVQIRNKVPATITQQYIVTPEVDLA